MLDDEKAKFMADRLADTEDYDPEADKAKAASGAAATAAVEALREKGLNSVGALNFLALNNEAPPRRTLLTVKGLKDRQNLLMPAGKVCMLAAPGGTGKTQLLFQLGVAVASGVRWLETYGVTKAGPVLLILGEEDEDEMHRRIRDATTGMKAWEFEPLISANLHVLSMCGQTAGMTDKEGEETDFYKILKEGLANWPDVAWSLIVLDPASRFLGPEAEIDNAAATRWIEAAERLTQIGSKPAVLFAHHTNKGALAGDTDQGAARGSSALTDGVRLQINLDLVTYPQLDAEDKPTGKRLRDPTRVILRVVKSNYGPVADPLFLLRDLDHGGFLAPDPDPPSPESKPSRAKKASKEAKADPARKNRDEATGRYKATGERDDVE